jgi:hypothetical protein
MSLVNLGELSKPATVLIERVSAAIGGAFKPFQIVRVAKAEAEAEIIRAEADVEIGEIHRRALRRFFNEEAAKQANIEEVTRKALPHLEGGARPEELEDDWIAHFFDRSRLVSDDQMQELWSRVLAGEANHPGAFSRRTINVLSSLDKRDAEQFTAVCAFGCTVDGEYVLLTFGYDHGIFKTAGITFTALSHLDSIGLIKFDGMGGFTLRGLAQHIEPDYFGRRLPLKLGNTMLTQAGGELARIVKPEPVEGFVSFLQTRWAGLIRPAPTDG